MAKITDTLVKRLKPPKSGQLYVHDDEVTGFCVRVSPRGTRTYLWYGSFQGTSHRVTLGRYPSLNAEQARDDAMAIRAGVAAGKHPIETQMAREGRRLGRERLLVRLVSLTDRIATDQIRNLDDLNAETLRVIDDPQEPAFNSGNRAWLASVVLGLSRLAANPESNIKGTEVSLWGAQLALQLLGSEGEKS